MSDQLLSFLAATGYYRRGYAMAFYPPSRTAVKVVCPLCGQPRTLLQSTKPGTMCRICAGKINRPKRRVPKPPRIHVRKIRCCIDNAHLTDGFEVDVEYRNKRGVKYVCDEACADQLYQSEEIIDIRPWKLGA